MNRRIVSSTLLASLAGVLLTGCMPKMTIEDMKAKMPKRPVELDKLDAFAGRWEATSEMRFAGLDEVLTGSGTSEFKWHADRSYLIEHSTFNMGELGEMQGSGGWNYDTHSKVYRSVWIDSMGGTGSGKMWQDGKTNTWHVRAVGHGPFGKSTGKGSMTFVDDNTLEWSWREYAMGGLFKVMEISGTSKRR